ncbi:MAG: putative baseplate assembly protein, partial [Gammaproteobacteria bacterium]
SSLKFLFKVNCPNDLDCVAATGLPPSDAPAPAIDYLSKDYRSFRRQMLERLSVIMPDYRERNAADIQIMLVELLAYAGDQLSYYQDAVATEAYLGTARQRRSLRRHARLLDYVVHQGCNARTWAQLAVTSAGSADGALLAQHTPLLSGWERQPVVIPPDETFDTVPATVVWFETLHAQRLHAAHNRIAIYTWGGAVTCLPAGSTGVDLHNDPPLQLQAGDALLLEQVHGLGSAGAPPDPDRRWVVRLTGVNATSDPLSGEPIMHVGWSTQDALPFELCLLAEVDNAGTPEMRPISVARGNMILADHGRRHYGNANEPGLSPSAPSEGAAFRPRLDDRNLCFAEPYRHRDALSEPASTLLEQNPRRALGVVSLDDGENTWTVQRDLLASDRFATDFVIEMEQDDTAYLRFGDGKLGKRPSAGDSFVTSYRIGNGRAGNIGADGLAHVVTGLDGISGVRNPLAAQGGTAAESAEEVRRYAPQAFRVQQRAVTTEDWVAAAQGYPEIQKARAQFRWTGSWYTVFITVDRIGGLPVLTDSRFLRGLLAHLDRYRVAGYDLEIREPLFVPLEIRLLVCLEPGYYAPDIKAQLLQGFSSVINGDGTPGFFHPDNFTFGQALYVSKLYAVAMAIDGIRSVQVTRLRRWGKTAAGELAAGMIKPAVAEILRCDSNPSVPENGAISFDIHGET